MVVPRDFAWLSEKVEERIQQRVSASTLRRFWGYVSEGVSASKFTKNVLANFLGYADFEEFGLSQGTGEQQSQMVIGKEISCDDLYEGQMLKLSWLPDRTCIIRYQGNGSFKVVSSENTRLAKFLAARQNLHHQVSGKRKFQGGVIRKYQIGER